jgi:D-sedoheptulose 7-phosphate isomerase
MNTKELLASRIEGSIAAVTTLRDQLVTIATIADLMIARLRTGGTIYTAGNGGSAAQALHLAEELIGRYRNNRRPLRAVCLNADPTALTCIANDFGFDEVFARQCDALLTAQDLLIVFSTSGNSPNIVQALRRARSRGATTIGLFGQGGGNGLDWCNHAIVIGDPGRDSALIQEAHQVVLHLLCEAAEAAFLATDH